MIWKILAIFVELKGKSLIIFFLNIHFFLRETLDKRVDHRQGFLYHVKIEHNLWNYIFFISYLKNKEKTEYTGFESYIANKLETNDITWFPLHK